MVTVTELTDITLSESNEFWGCQVPGGYMLGSPEDRPVRIVGERIMYASLKEPLYGAGWGVSGGTAILSASSFGSGDMTGNVLVCESFYREYDDEASNLGRPHSATALNLGSSGVSLSITSSAVAPSTELHITHRLFWLNYTDTLGAYYLAAKIPYTGGADNVVIDITAEALVANEAAPEGYENSLFPPVCTADFWRQRLFGGKLEARGMLEDSTVTLTNGSNEAVIAGDTWRESDVYKGIVNNTTGQVIAYIDRVLTSTRARCRFPNQATDTSDRWPTYTGSTTTYSDWFLTGEDSMIYVSGIDTLGPSGSARYGYGRWNPLNQIRNDNLFNTGARLQRIIRQNEDLLAIYDRGVSVFQGQVSIGDPPELVQFLLAEKVGSFTPQALCVDDAGALLMWGHNRLYRVTTGGVEDVTQQLGASRFWQRFVENSTEVRTAARCAYNPDLGMGLLVGVLRRDEDEENARTYSVAYCQDSPGLFPLRWSRALSAICCTLTDNGWRFIGAGDRGLYWLLKPEKYVDDYVDADGETVNNGPIGEYLVTPRQWHSGHAKLLAYRLLVESDLTSGLTFNIAADFKRSNIVTGTFDDAGASTTALTFSDLSTIEELVPQECVEGWSSQFKITATHTGEVALVALQTKLELSGEKAP